MHRSTYTWYSIGTYPGTTTYSSRYSLLSQCDCFRMPGLQRSFRVEHFATFPPEKNEFEYCRQHRIQVPRRPTSYKSPKLASPVVPWLEKINPILH